MWFTLRVSHTKIVLKLVFSADNNNSATQQLSLAFFQQLSVIPVIYQVILSWYPNSMARSCSDYLRGLDDVSVTPCALGDFSVTFCTCDGAFVNFWSLDVLSPVSSVESSTADQNYWSRGASKFCNFGRFFAIFCLYSNSITSFCRRQWLCSSFKEWLLWFLLS